MSLDIPSDQPLSQMLRLATRTTHDRLDAAIMAARPFADLGRYGGLVRINAAFLALASPLYQAPALAALLPGLPARDRAAAALQDLATLGLMPEPAPTPAPHPSDTAAALGWLYVAEGSRLGGAVLLSHARGLGLNPDHGARHLAPDPGQGPARHWASFCAALDAVPLDMPQRQAAVAGARTAFRTVRDLVDQIFGA